MATSSTRLVLICGLPASGKSTLARQLAMTIPAVRLDKDEWMTAPITGAHLEQWGTTFQPPDDEEMLLFDEHRDVAER